MRYFTSDWHLNSTQICAYAKRPFTTNGNIDQMLRGCNSIASAEDTVIHVGDFVLVGYDRHGKFSDYGDPAHDEKFWLPKVKANMVLLAGNHDDNHNCETAAKIMVVDLNQRWRNVTVSHHPSYSKEYLGWHGSAQNAHVHLCGHVHHKWLLCWDSRKHVMNINVGVDVWDYKPVKDSELTKLLDYVWNAKMPAPDKMDRVQFEDWKARNEKLVEAERQRRKLERYAKKGLTPEECERRKTEAMKKKGLAA